MTPHNDDFFLSEEKQWLRCRVFGNDPEYSREGSDIFHHWAPLYRSGDILYVRETWGDYSDGTKHYDVDGHECDLSRWRPSIHMPKEAARLFLQVTNVRAERLWDITETHDGFRKADLANALRWIFEHYDFKGV